MKTETRHQCLIYEGAPSQKLPMLAYMIYHKLQEGYKCLYLNNPPMVDGMRTCLSAMDVDVAHEIARDSLVLSAQPVSTGKGFDVDQMLSGLEDAIDQALKDGYKGLWATGDMTWEFGPERNFEKLMEYEWRLEDMFRRRKELSGICQYHRNTLPHEVMRQGLLMHGSVFVNETLSRINPLYTQGNLPTTQMAINPALDMMVNEFCELGHVHT